MLDMSNYKMIYNEQVYNVVGLAPIFDFDAPDNQDAGLRKPKFIEGFVINIDGELVAINDETWRFKFVRK